MDISTFTIILSTLVYPNPKLTPGMVAQQTTMQRLCTPGYTSTVRNVPEEEKEAVFAEYGIPLDQRSLYEVDHFISLELGGSNDIKNLWPEPWKTPTLTIPNAFHSVSFILGARQKDVVETSLHRRVCAGVITLQEAQRIIRTDWVAEYRRIKKL